MKVEKNRTPGKWEIARGVSGALYVNGQAKSNAGLQVVARILSRRENIEADARLIAAAPELLEAIIQYIDLGEAVSADGLDYEKDKLAIGDLFARHQKARERLDRVITKATGGK